MDPREVSEDFFDGLGEIWERYGLPNQDCMDKIKDAQFALLLQDTSIINPADIGGTEHLISQYPSTHDDKVGPSRRSPEKTTQLDKMEEKVTPSSKASHDTNTDGPSDAAGNSLIKQADTGEIKHLISQNQETHNEAGSSRRIPQILDKMKKKVTQNSRASHDTNIGKKRKGPPLNEEEKKEHKKNADRKYRDKCKAHLQMLKTLQNLVIQKGDREMIEAMQILETEIYGRRCMNQSLIVEQDTIIRQLDTEITINEQIKSKFSASKETLAQKEQLVDLLWNVLKCFQEMPPDQEENERLALNTTITQQLHQLLNNVLVEQEQEDNERLGFAGDGRPIATSVSEIQPMMNSEMPQLVEKLKRELLEETKKQMDAGFEEMRRAVEATTSERMNFMILRLKNEVFKHK